MADMVLKNGLIVTPEGVIEGGIAIEGGVIVALGPDRALPSAGEQVDLKGHVALPGMIDPHVHLGVGGSADEAKLLEDMTTETSAAALGGVTAIVTDHEHANGPSWVTTVLERDGETLLDRAKREASERSPIDFRYTANPASDADLDEIPALVDAGVSSFKMFPSYVGEEAEEFGITTVGYDFIFRALERIAAAETDEQPAQGMVHCEEASICTMLKERYRAQGHEELQWWTRARPAVCEAMQIFDVGMMALETGSRVYIPHVSSDEGARAIEYLMSRGVRIIGETCAQYLLRDVPWHLGSLAKVNPPLRGPEDADGLWASIGRGVIRAVGSDNCRYPRAEKHDDVWTAIPGISEIGATLPLLLTEGIHAGRISWTDLARIGAEGAARAFGMYPRKGVLAVGSDADVVVVDPHERWTLGTDVPLSGADWSIYEGREVVGRPVLTVSRGRVVAERGALVARGGGAYVASGRAVG
jgi:dihydroorotase-like cyclic amidohydrolase